MRDVEVGRVARAVRRRKGWRQEDVSSRAGVHRSTQSMVERRQLEDMTLRTIRRCLEAVDVRLELLPRWRGPELDRLLDEAHASLQAGWKGRLERWGWDVVAEASFKHYGERGRIDLLCWQPQERILLVIEIKTELVDAQGLLGPLDVKVRVAARVAAERGWGRPAHVLPVLILREGTAVRQRVARLVPLFSGFDLRGKAAISWLRRPVSVDSLPTRGLLIYSKLRAAAGGRVKQQTSHRVRPRQGNLSVEPAAVRATAELEGT